MSSLTPPKRADTVSGSRSKTQRSQPDDPEAAQRFKEIDAAYQIPSDPQKRKMFDYFGAASAAARPVAGPSTACR